MATIEAFAKQDPQTGKWGYGYSYKVDGKAIGGAGQSEYIYDTQEEAEAAILALKPELDKKIHDQTTTDRIKTGAWIAVLLAMLFVIGSGVSDIYNRLADEYKPKSFGDKAQIAFVSMLEYPMPVWKQFFEASLLLDQTVNKDQNETQQ